MVNFIINCLGEPIHTFKFENDIEFSKCILFQCIYILLTEYYIFQINHKDIHKKQILIKKNSEKKTLCYVINEKIFKFECYYIVHIVDFGNSTHHSFEEYSLIVLEEDITSLVEVLKSCNFNNQILKTFVTEFKYYTFEHVSEVDTFKKYSSAIKISAKYNLCSFYDDMENFFIKPINLFNNRRMNTSEENNFSYKLSFESLKKKQIIDIDENISFLSVDDNSMIIKCKEKRILFEFSNEERNKNLNINIEDLQG